MSLTPWTRSRRNRCWVALSEKPRTNLIMGIDPGKTFPDEVEMPDKLAKDADEGQPHAPFLSRQEWEVCHWLSIGGLSQDAIDNFLKLI
ncbi:uncharacterized protein EI90DRAFT_3060857 [Cantharellus anzutake]|uniref:uncharacterized protein n=1 Tax=Cantharellus anzutake TaxID=1750568 RepID=UPI001904A201|nr:uncharacterized protein EI90DRAFT_3077753 [Cantharellus anzutake]XP_038915327.1 uncharacterized protein EI90DRAFT_3060857 [Cantharellus anzutake]KAF8322777.1 hypothetical protein EI90DRAFT_3077753 [Cantharellus anzutake]KAF8330148.1 hypothetical protein EI90DRAFT_3060857 [Cantharellus anzutake]